MTRQGIEERVFGEGGEEQYCFHSTFTIKPDGVKVQVAVSKNKASDKFIVY